MTLFPTSVYRCPGPHWGPFGTTYDSRGAADEEALAALLAEGWHATLPAAAEAFLNPPAPVVEAPPAEPVPAPVIPADDEPPTRAEMLEQAAKHGLKVDRRWSDARLMEKISEAMRRAPAVVSNDHGDDDPI